MFFRGKFVTNSSTTSFIAWGIILPVKEDVEEGKEDLYFRAYRGNEKAAARRDDFANYLIYAKESVITLDEYSETIKLNNNEVMHHIRDGWEKAIRNFAEELGLDISFYSPSWFYTRYDS